jgi:hypothetical protein
MIRKPSRIVPCLALICAFASSLAAAQPELASADWSPKSARSLSTKSLSDDVAIAPAETIAQAAGQPAPRESAAQIWPTVSQAQSEAEYPEQWKAQRRAEAAIAANSWVLKVPHVKGMMPALILDKNLPHPLTNEDILRGIGETGIRLWVDEPQNVREVEGHVPSQLSGVPVLIEANPTNFILY